MGYLKRLAWLSQHKFEKYRQSQAMTIAAAGQSVLSHEDRIKEIEKRLKELESIVKGHE